MISLEIQTPNEALFIPFNKKISQTLLHKSFPRIGREMPTGRVRATNLLVLSSCHKKNHALSLVVTGERAGESRLVDHFGNEVLLQILLADEEALFAI